MTQLHRVIEGTAILDRLHQALTRYVVLPSPEAIDAVVLWVAASHAVPAWAYAPRLVIRAPEKRCGKSRLLDIVEGTCFNPLITVNASPAAVYRSIGTDDPPTILLDEADTIFGGKQAEANEDLRGLLNAGHQRNRPTIRWDNARNRMEKIGTFAMAALAGIGQMPDTIEDRAVVIRMRRRANGEKVAPYRQRRDGPGLQQIANDLNQWIRGHLPALERAEPTMPLEDRAADTWEPLIAVADLAGGDWPGRSRHAAESLTAERDGHTVTSDRIRLLTDCRAAFGQHDAIPTAVLLDRLKTDPEAPWADYGGTGLSAMKLGSLLREYDITSGNVRFTTGQAKGYQRADFTDAWQRYCPDPDGEASQPSQPSPPSSAPGRLAKVVRLKPSQPALDDGMPPPPADATGTA
ncbi:DUF3631 domain-containing protein [Actinoplanes couchii]|uniref:DUF3631 domain-containing protein n=1 Tax=Actinoplanes couchii TaxID=403638 RepID=A0ABQ3XIX3_9ACTN|nr:DUF3631 domain-containing protein [Actinoplanes couchii]MDR6323894.1 hypothetical protein [Actinoplanes couchii]GID58365.1 hypothetical protein Aco03nite_067690 [Actinoplanes couchii]